MDDHVYKTIWLTGSSPNGMEDAVQNALSRASKTLHNLRWFEVTEIRGHMEGGKIAGIVRVDEPVRLRQVRPTARQDPGGPPCSVPRTIGC